MIWQRSGSGSARIFRSAMNALISATVARASATSVSGLPWSLPSSSSTRADHRAAALGVVGRERPAGERLRPQLPGDHVHLALDAVRLGLGLRQAPRRPCRPGVEFQLQLLGELLPADPPVVGRTGAGPRPSGTPGAPCSAVDDRRGLLAELPCPFGSPASVNSSSCRSRSPPWSGGSPSRP